MQVGDRSPINGFPVWYIAHDDTKFDQVLRQVGSRLDRFTSIDRRHQKVTALLLLQDGAEDELGSTSIGGVYYHPSHNQRFRVPTNGGRERTVGPQSRLRVGSQGGGKINSSRRKHVAGFGLAPVPRTKSRGCNNGDNISVLTPGGGALTAMLSKMAVDGVGRDIAHVRKGGRNMSDATRCGGSRLPSSSLPEGPFDANETRGVLFGFGARLGRYNPREDRWL